jgi:putative ABC transport system permease protein
LVNNQPFERDLESTKLTREREAEARFRNRGLNITIRDRPSQSEKILSKLSNPSSELLPLSLETRFADRLNLKLGDLVTLEIQGMEFQAQVAELRSVKWNSFLPNFFVQTQSGHLDEAPKTWLLALARMNPDTKIDLMKKIAQKFSSITILDVDLIINQLIKWTQDFTKILTLTATSQLIIGVFVIWILILLDLNSRKEEYLLYSYLGFTHQSIRIQKVFEVVLLVATSILIALSFSYIVSKILVTLFMSW